MPRLSRKDQTPLLSKADHTSSDGAAAATTTGTRAGGLRRLFGRGGGGGNSQQQKQQQKRKARAKSVPAIRKATSSSTTTTTTTLTRTRVESARPLTERQSSNRIMATNNSTLTPPRRLQENAKDTKRKNRPYPVPIRKSRTNPEATDAPPVGMMEDEEREMTTKQQQTTEESLETLPPPTTKRTESARSNALQEEKKQEDDQEQQQDGSHTGTSVASDRYREIPAQSPAISTKRSHAGATVDTVPMTAAATGKQVLQRPFGRLHLPVRTRTWVVEVGSAEWDADQWKYRILIQRRQMTAQEVADREHAQFTKGSSNSANNNPPPLSTSSQSSSSFTAAFTWRSVRDFSWLEQALQQEYHGALLVPVLEIALGGPAAETGMPVEPEILRHWLSDVLNGVRGQGELLLPLETNLLTESTSLESFLYKNAGPLAPPPRAAAAVDTEEPFFLSRLIRPLEHLCVGPPPMDSDGNMVPMRSSHNRLDVLSSCTSRALGTAPSLDVQDSMAETLPSAAPMPRMSSKLALHSELLQAQLSLVLNYRCTALKVLDKMRILKEHEERVGLAWRRFAVALANLFSYEKDVENAKIGDSKVQRDHVPYRKIGKTTMDESLRILARQLVERSPPALDALSEMMTAYMADLSMVEPAVTCYSEAAQAMVQDKEKDDSDTSWEARIRRSLTVNRKKRPDMLKQAKIQQDRDVLYQHERLLQESLGTMCRATTVRVARMAYRYWQTEATQCAALHKAASTLRKQLDAVNKEAVSNMISRHLTEDTEDYNVETKLVDRLVSMGRAGKEEEDEEDASATYDDDEPEDRYNEKSARRADLKHKAVATARARMGRWDAAVAMALMEAVGVQDPNVRVEQTTRDLRLVRKYAIGLREHVTRCREALQMIREAITGEGEEWDDGQPRLPTVRDEFLAEVCKLFSGTFVEDTKGPRRSSVSRTVLLNAGIDTNDPLGWIPGSTHTAYYNRASARSTFSQGRVGDLAVAYTEARNDKTIQMLEHLLALIEDYYKRIEIVEGYVYMECVGIQLEQHFSEKRAAALSAFEKKTDILSAINIATRKRLPDLVKELETKLEKIGTNVSHTTVKQTKEEHLESKTLKSDLHDLAMRRLMRAREASTERAVMIMSRWATEEEASSTAELSALGEAISALERAVCKEDLEVVAQPESSNLSTI